MQVVQDGLGKGHKRGTGVHDSHLVSALLELGLGWSGDGINDVSIVVHTIGLWGPVISSVSFKIVGGTADILVVDASDHE